MRRSSITHLLLTCQYRNQRCSGQDKIRQHRWSRCLQRCLFGERTDPL